MKSFTPFLIIALCAGMYFMYISPTLSDISDKKTKKEEYQTVLDKIKDLKEKRDSLSTVYNNIPAADLEMLNKIIPEKFDPVLFANNLNSIAIKYGMALKDVKASPADPGIPEDAQVGDKKYKTVSVRMSLNGRYDQFLSFLKDLETNLQLVDVVSLSIRGGSGSAVVKKVPLDLNLDYQLEVQTYSL